MAKLATETTLKVPEVAKQDATLASILLLDLANRILPRKMDFYSHISVAVDFVKNCQSLNTSPSGQLMFLAIRTQMIMQSLSASTPPDNDEVWWPKHTIGDKNASECHKLCMEVAALAAETYRLLKDEESVRAIGKLVRKCLDLDQKCSLWPEDLPRHLQYHRLYWHHPSSSVDYNTAEVYSGHILLYSDRWVATIWNMMRCARIVLNLSISRCLMYSSSGGQACESIASTMTGLVDDIIATVPYQLGCVGSLVGDGSLMGQWGTSVIWPLAMIVSLACVKKEQRIWIRARLKHISSRLGIGLAQLILDKEQAQDLGCLLPWLEPPCSLHQVPVSGLIISNQLPRLEALLQAPGAPNTLGVPGDEGNSESGQFAVVKLSHHLPSNTLGLYEQTCPGIDPGRQNRLFPSRHYDSSGVGDANER
ncbi:hypothetical protein VCV18_012527 [Metarhizium anisopliae]